MQQSSNCSRCLGAGGPHAQPYRRHVVLVLCSTQNCLAQWCLLCGVLVAAKVAALLMSVLPGCPAGTPISHGGRADLLGLLKFLQVPHIPKGETPIHYGLNPGGRVLLQCNCDMSGHTAAVIILMATWPGKQVDM
jgi:hypothetical protein